MSTRQAEVLILGAGALGAALAWRLAARGVVAADAIRVVDPNPLGSQATSRAAALLSLARPAAKAHWIGLVDQTLHACAALARAGHPIPLHRCGALHLADGETALAVLEDHAATAAMHKVACEDYAPQAFAPFLPWLDMPHFKRALWFPDEAYIDPYLLAGAFATAARALGVHFQTGLPVALLAPQAQEPPGHDHVEDEAAPPGPVRVQLGDEILTPTSIWLATGAWTSRALLSLQQCAPQAAVRSQYWITEPTHLAPPGMPIAVAPDLKLYSRPELGAILFGLRESPGLAVPSADLPPSLEGFVFPGPDATGHATLESAAAALEHYAPGLLQTGLRHYITGPSCYTPDGDFLLGAVPDTDNLKMIGGCNGAGIAASVGLANLACDLEAGTLDPVQARRYDPARFGAVDADSPQFLQRCIDVRAGKTSG